MGANSSRDDELPYYPQYDLQRYPTVQAPQPHSHQPPPGGGGPSRQSMSPKRMPSAPTNTPQPNSVPHSSPASYQQQHDDHDAMSSFYDDHDNVNDSNYTANNTIINDNNPSNSDQNDDDVPHEKRLAKRQIEVYYRQFFSMFNERKLTLARIDSAFYNREIDETTRNQFRREQYRREIEYIRRKRNPMSISQYDIIRKIGQGSFGEVFLVRNRSDNQLYAMKKLRKEDMIGKRQVTHVWLERFVLASIGEHPLVVKMYCSFQDEHYLYFVMEYLHGGDMMTMLVRHEYLPESWAKFYIAELCVAIDALHRTGIIHRDIKPDNILFRKDGHICLSDFGLSKCLHHAQQYLNVDESGQAQHTDYSIDYIQSIRRGDIDLPLQDRINLWKRLAREKAFSQVGTPNYVAPEVLQDNVYTESCDWWSVGIILFEMFAGYPPFCSRNPMDVTLMICQWRRYLYFPEQILVESRMSTHAKNLIERLICDPANRLGAKRGIEEFKEHPFFEGVDWDNLARVEAPFIPHLDSDTDTKYFEDDITSSSVSQTASSPMSTVATNPENQETNTVNTQQSSASTSDSYSTDQQSHPYSDSSNLNAATYTLPLDETPLSPQPTNTDINDRRTQDQQQMQQEGRQISSNRPQANQMAPGSSVNRKRSRKLNANRDLDFVGFTFVPPTNNFLSGSRFSSKSSTSKSASRSSLQNSIPKSLSSTTEALSLESNAAPPVRLLRTPRSREAVAAIAAADVSSFSNVKTDSNDKNNDNDRNQPHPHNRSRVRFQEHDEHILDGQHGQRNQDDGRIDDQVRRRRRRRNGRPDSGKQKKQDKRPVTDAEILSQLGAIAVEEVEYEEEVDEESGEDNTPGSSSTRIEVDNTAESNLPVCVSMPELMTSNVAHQRYDDQSGYLDSNESSEEGGIRRQVSQLDMLGVSSSDSEETPYDDINSEETPYDDISHQNSMEYEGQEEVDLEQQQSEEEEEEEDEDDDGEDIFDDDDDADNEDDHQNFSERFVDGDSSEDEETDDSLDRRRMPRSQVDQYGNDSAFDSLTYAGQLTPRSNDEMFNIARDVDVQPSVVTPRQ